MFTEAALNSFINLTFSSATFCKFCKLPKDLKSFVFMFSLSASSKVCSIVRPVILEKLLLTTLSSTPADIKLSCKLAKYLIRDNTISLNCGSNVFKFLAICSARSKVFLSFRLSSPNAMFVLNQFIVALNVRVCP